MSIFEETENDGECRFYRLTVVEVKIEEELK